MRGGGDDLMRGWAMAAGLRGSARLGAALLLPLLLSVPAACPAPGKGTKAAAACRLGGGGRGRGSASAGGEGSRFPCARSPRAGMGPAGTLEEAGCLPLLLGLAAGSGHQVFGTHHGPSQAWGSSVLLVPPGAGLGVPLMGSGGPRHSWTGASCMLGVVVSPSLGHCGCCDALPDGPPPPSLQSNSIYFLSEGSS